MGGKTYQFVAALSNIATANEVLAGTEQVSLQNLALAVNGGTGAGTNYATGTTQNANVTAGTASTTALTFTASNTGTAGNFITGAASAHGGFANSGVFTGGLNTGTAPIATAGDTVSVGGTTHTYVNALSPTAVASQYGGLDFSDILMGFPTRGVPWSIVARSIIADG